MAYITFMRVLASLVLALITLSSCARRPGSDVLQPMDTKAYGAKTVTAYVASTRQESDRGKGFGTDRAAKANYAQFDISIPPTHKKGKIEWASGKPNPKTDFVVTGANMLSEETFNSDLGRIAKSGRQIGLFVHGYNHSYQEALFRGAQMAADADIDGIPVVFSWPSQAKVTGYIADKLYAFNRGPFLNGRRHGTHGARGRSSFVPCTGDGSSGFDNVSIE